MMLVKWKAIMCQEDDEKGKCSDVVWQSLWQETKGGQRRKEGTAKPLHHTCQTCHNHTQEPPVDETIIATSE